MRTPCIAALLLPLILLTACEKEPEDPYLGKFDYFSCKINGVPLETRGKFSCPGVHASYYPRGTQHIQPGFFTASGQNCYPDEFERVGIGITVLDPLTYQYSLLSDSVRISYQPKVFYTIDSAISGAIHFSTIIPQQYNENGQRVETGKVEGTFYATLIDTAGQEIRITDGKFGFYKIQ